MQSCFVPGVSTVTVNLLLDTITNSLGKALDSGSGKEVKTVCCDISKIYENI